MIMAYCDMTNVEFWGGLRSSNEGYVSIPEECKKVQSRGLVHDRLIRNWQDHVVPPEMLAEMHLQLLALHDADSKHVPPPIGGAYQDWCDEPYGCAVHFWNRGHKSWELLERMVHPIHDVPCYVCGEAYSTNQTWVEGALETADIILEKQFGIPEFY